MHLNSANTKMHIYMFFFLFFFKGLTFRWSRKLLITAAALITGQNACEEGSYTCPALPARGVAPPAGT